MRLVIATTETTHHNFIVRELIKGYPITHVLCETESVSPPFEVFHPYMKLQEEHELSAFSSGKLPSLESLAPTTRVDTINSVDSRNTLVDLKPDVVIVAGTRRWGIPLIEACSARIVNLHGGDPESYRGLDSHLWAIYHGDFESFFVTLHRLNAELDDGEVIAQGRILLDRDMKFHELRARNAQLCVELLVDALQTYERVGDFVSTPQQRKGRYYSFMPTVLKDICVARFERFTAKL